MRDALKQIDGERREFVGTFSRYGRKPGWKGAEVTTILLINVRDATGRKVCDHLWFNMTKEFAAVGLQPGVDVRFAARSKSYLKGFIDKSADWKLSHPTHVRLAESLPIESLPLFAGLAESSAL